MDYVMGEGINRKFDKKTLKRLQEIELLDDPKRQVIFLIDTYIRDAKGRKAYAA